MMEGSSSPSNSSSSGGRKVIRRASSLHSVVRRKTVAPERPDVDLKQLVRIYFLDGSSKVLQVKASSTTKDLLLLLQYNLDLQSIKCHALFRICHKKVRRLDLKDQIKAVTTLQGGEEGDVKILMRAWIHDEEGLFDKEAMQDGHFPKESNSALHMKYTEAVCMVMMGKCFLTEDEAVMLGCLKMQADSGDYSSEVHTIARVQSRAAASFPSPAKERMQTLLDSYAPGLPEQMAARIQLLYSRLAGYSKAEAQIEFLRTLRIWCPFYSASFFTVETQYDSSPNDPHSQPPVVKMSVGVSKQAIFLITLTDPHVILRQPYNRIVKWVAHVEMNIFCYWILKADFSPHKVEELERAKKRSLGNDLDSIVIEGEEEENEEAAGTGAGAGAGDGAGALNPALAAEYCDCVYLVSEYTAEIELVFSAYLALLRDRTPPLLPGDEPDPEDEEGGGSGGEGTRWQGGGAGAGAGGGASTGQQQRGEQQKQSSPGVALNSKKIKETSSKKQAPSTKRSSMFNKLFMSTTNTGDENDDDNGEDEEEEYNMGGIVDHDFEESNHFFDQDGGAGSQQNVAFQEELFPPLSAGNIDILNGGTGASHMAATMDELNELTFKDFLDDDEEDDDDDEEEDSDNSSASGDRVQMTSLDKPPAAAATRRNSLFKWS